MANDTDALLGALREANDLVAHLQQRTTELHVALLRTARELAEARKESEHNDNEDG